MHTAITFVLLFSLRTISLAADVTVYDNFYYDFGIPENLVPGAVSQFPWKFGYSWQNESFFMNIFISNKSPSVTAIKVTYQLDDRTAEVEKSTYNYGRRNGEECYYVHVSDLIKFTEIKITLMVYTSKILCSSLLVAKGKENSTITNEPMKNEYPYYDIFTKYGYVLEVDLINKYDGPPLVIETKMSTTTENHGTGGETTMPNTFTFNSSTNLEITTNKNSAIDTKNAERQSSVNIVLIYVIPSVIVLCIIILVIYFISVKKYCHRHSDPVETIELNTYSTVNEVVYADLSLLHGDSKPPKRDEESPYARIIGVLNPVVGNVNNK